jgi:hypothetical protein
MTASPAAVPGKTQRTESSRGWRKPERRESAAQGTTTRTWRFMDELLDV